MTSYDMNNNSTNNNRKLFLKIKGNKANDEDPWYINNPANVIRKGLQRIIDSMTYSEIYEMYDKEDYRCDTCGRPLKDDGELHISIKDHVIHLLNPSIIWSCIGCINNDFKKRRVIMTTSTTKAEAATS